MALSYFFLQKNDFPRTGDNVWLANFSITYFCQPCYISRCPDKSKNKIQHKRWTNLHVWGDFKRLSDAESSLGSKGRMKISCLQEKAAPVSVCMKQWLCNRMLTIWSQSCGAVIMYQKEKKKTIRHLQSQAVVWSVPHSSSVRGGRGDGDDRARPGAVCVRLHISLSRLSRHCGPGA